METKVINIASGVRNQKDQPQIQTVKASDLAGHIKADGAQVVTDNEGRKHFHLMNSKTGDYFSIRVGKKVTLTKEGNDVIPELLNGYVIYTGTTDINGQMLEKPWFTFGPIPTAQTPVAVVTGDALTNMLKAATQNLTKGA